MCVTVMPSSTQEGMGTITPSDVATVEELKFHVERLKQDLDSLYSTMAKRQHELAHRQNPKKPM
jgi:hypothetical protein